MKDFLRITAIDELEPDNESGYYVAAQLEGLRFETQLDGNGRMQPYGWSIPVSEKADFEATDQDTAVMVRVEDNVFTASRRWFHKRDIDEINVIDGDRVVGRYIRQRRFYHTVDFVWEPAV